MKLNLYDNKGKELSQKVELDDSVFNAPINKKLLTQYIYVFQNNQRQSNAQTKDRGEVSGGGRKPWRQKGTGRARHGSIRSPIWKGGGVTFGPSNELSFKRKFNKKMLKRAFRSAFTTMAKSESIKVFENLKFTDKKTSSLAKVLTNAKLTNKTVVLQNKVDSDLLQAARNLANLKVAVINELNPYQIVNCQQLVILADVLPTISKFWGEPKVTKPIKKTNKPVKKVVKKVAKTKPKLVKKS